MDICSAFFTYLDAKLSFIGSLVFGDYQPQRNPAAVSFFLFFQLSVLLPPNLPNINSFFLLFIRFLENRVKLTIYLIVSIYLFYY